MREERYDHISTHITGIDGRVMPVGICAWLGLNGGGKTKGQMKANERLSMKKMLNEGRVVEVPAGMSSDDESDSDGDETDPV